MMTAHFPPVWILVLALSLALSSLNSKAMGLAWALLVLHGAWVALQNRGQIGHASAYPWAKLWLLVSAAALTIKGIAVFYWSDSWGERHGELRLFFGALALYALLNYQHLERRSLSLIAHSLTISSAVGLMWVVIYGRGALPTHPIPWAGSMAMVSAFLLALYLKSDYSSTHKRIWLIGGLFSVMAVLTSQSRGAYWIVLWWLVVGIHHVWRSRANQQIHRAIKPRSPWHWALAFALMLTLAALSQTPVFQRPAQSLQDAIDEIRVSSQSTAQGANSSVGARLYMWQNSLIAIGESPWIGHGHDTRKQLIQVWAESAQSDEVKRLGHVHNEFLHQWIDHGLWGLGSQIFFLGSLIFMAWKLNQKNHFTAALSLGGLAFIHMTSSLTNVNFAHNYYTASLSFFVVMSLWLSRLETVDDRI
jgi:O-antigen ligase